MASPLLRFLSRLLALSALFCGTTAQAQIFADFETTGGNFTIEMFHQDQPMAVANFIGLADGSLTWLDQSDLKLKQGVPFYDGIKFHRVIKDFMIQGGSPNGVGTDGPGYEFIDQFARDADGALLHPHDRQGLISMANSGINTNGSQFFITDVPTPWLDGVHIVFGKIAAGPFGTLEEGIAAITAMNNTPVTGNSPITDLVINKIAIRRVGDEAMAFDVHAQRLPVLSAPPAEFLFEPSPDGSGIAELSYAKPELTQINVISSDDLQSWKNLKSAFYGETDSTTDDVSALLATKDAQFFRLIQLDYSQSPHAGGPASVARGSLKLDFDANIFDIDLIIDDSGTDGTWNRPDGQGGGTLQSFQYEPRAAAYVDRIVVNYEGLVTGSDFVFIMDIRLSFDSPTGGRFQGTTNGSPQRIGGTFQWVAPQ
ncbi:MAG: peptidylprolyl isomerase [Verrucomicrobiales bacterium]